MKHGEGDVALQEDPSSFTTGFQVALGIEMDVSSLVIDVGAAGHAADPGVATSGAALSLGVAKRFKPGKALFFEGAVDLFKGTVNMTGTDMTGAEVEADGSSAFGLYGGAAYRWGRAGGVAIRFSGGLALWRYGTDELGSLLGVGPEVRVRLTWNMFRSKGGGGGGSGRSEVFTTRTNDGKILVVLDIGQPVGSGAIDLLYNGAVDAGCTDITRGGGGFTAMCQGEPVIVVTTGNRIGVQCEPSAGEDKCQTIFYLVVANAIK